METVEIPGTVAGLAAEILPHLEEHFPGPPAEPSADQQMLKLLEEIGELAAAIRAWTRTDDPAAAAELGDEVADVMITAHIVGLVLGFELDKVARPAAFRPTLGEQVDTLHEMWGRLLKLHNRWAGHSRKGRQEGQLQAMAVILGRIADMARSIGERAGLDVDACWQAKAMVIMTRGWTEAAAA
jgi:NTP pyrophosphatase (non-canonical NTP hydrolase)